MNMVKMRDLDATLKVELMGRDKKIRDACCDLCELANRVGCLVEANFNDVLLWARQGNNPLKLVEAYNKCLKEETTIKIAKAF